MEGRVHAPMCVDSMQGGCQTRADYEYCCSRKQPMCGGHTALLVDKLSSEQRKLLREFGELDEEDAFRAVVGTCPTCHRSDGYEWDWSQR